MKKYVFSLDNFAAKHFHICSFQFTRVKKEKGKLVGPGTCLCAYECLCLNTRGEIIQVTMSEKDSSEQAILGDYFKTSWQFM